MRQDIQALLAKAVDWVTQNAELKGLALAGSYAHGTATATSDIDLCLFTDNVELFFHDTAWCEQFGPVSAKQTEDWGVVKTLRVFYENATEVEWNFSSLAWASLPPDSGTARVVKDGIRILYDPTEELAAVQRYCATEC